mmetsp:Transcript_8927/g.27013  ORF Transcript_8927/g.27013 Transcript_8927/m.27013 type:complete len:291 (+) Transcript_8927:492-1364(+)
MTWPESGPKFAAAGPPSAYSESLLASTVTSTVTTTPKRGSSHIGPAAATIWKADLIPSSSTAEIDSRWPARPSSPFDGASSSSTAAEIPSLCETAGLPIVLEASSPDSDRTDTLPAQSKFGPTYSGPRDHTEAASRREDGSAAAALRALATSGTPRPSPIADTISPSRWLSEEMSFATSSGTNEVLTSNWHIPFWVLHPLCSSEVARTVSRKVTSGGDVKISHLAKDSRSSLMHDSMWTSPAAHTMCSPSLDDSISTNGSALYRSSRPLASRCRSAGFFGSTAFLSMGAD